MEAPMAYVLVTAVVQNIEEWKAGFAAAASLRGQFGSSGGRVFRPSGKSNEVVILGQYDSLERARELFSSEQFREAARKAGLTAPPQVTYLEHLMDFQT
jgi:uncharacterized protein (DUF1330 family)